MTPPNQTATKVVVKPAEPLHFRLLRDPAPPAPASRQLAARVYDQQEELMTGAPVSWSSTNKDIASVDSSGVVTAHAKGTCSIIAVAQADPEVADRVSCEVVAG